MKILLTGANSFLGRHLAARLVADGHAVTGTYRTEDHRLPALQRLGRAFAAVRVDLAEADGMERLPPRIDAVVHIAGTSLGGEAAADAMIGMNVTGTRNVIRYALAARAAKVVHASTLSVHGRIMASVVDEHTPVNDPDIYGASKLLGERLFAAEGHGLPCAALRLPGVLGAGAHRAWLPTLLQRAKENEPIEIYNPDSPFNNAAHVDDLAEFVATLLDREWQGFHAMPLGARGTLAVREVVSRIVQAVGSRSRLSVNPVKQPGFVIDSTLATERFGYRPMEIGAMVERFAREG